MIVVGELGNILNSSSGTGKSLKDFSDISSLLHGDDSELILFVDPDEESLLVVVEDASAFWPVSVKTAGIKEAVTLFEEEMVCDQLILLSLSHRSERVESSSELALECVASLNNLLLNFISLLSCDSRAKRIVCQVTANSDTC